MAAYIQGAIQISLKQIFGEIGGLTEIEVLNLQVADQKFHLKVPKQDLRKVRAALTLIPNFQGNPCHFRVNQVTSILIQAIQ